MRSMIAGVELAPSLFYSIQSGYSNNNPFLCKQIKVIYTLDLFEGLMTVHQQNSNMISII